MGKYLAIACCLAALVQCSYKTTTEHYLSEITSGISVRQGDTLIKVDLNRLERKIKVQSDLTYYWFQPFAVHHTVGGYSGNLLNGTFASFYPSGALLEKGEFDAGLKEATITGFFENISIQIDYSLKF
ncbi:MAG: hypothetical protein WD077_06585 [Bacteroidia bacterium]